MKNKNSTRFYSSNQEKSIAKVVKGRCQTNSGATLFSKGDVASDNWLFEAKTCMTEKQSFTIKREWLDKLEEEAFAMNKEFFSLVFNFGFNNKNYFILDEKTFKQILLLLDEME